MTPKHEAPLRSRHLGLLLLLFAAARWQLLGHLDSPVVGWRPTDMAAIALSYYRNGFHFLYPQVFWGVSGHGYVEMEFPLVPFTTAILLKVLGEHEWVNVICPLAFGFGLVWVTYSFGRYLRNGTVGFVAGLVVALAPNLVMLTDTGIYADPPMVFFGALGLYWLVRWSDDGRQRSLFAAAVAVALAILLKLPALYLGIPVAVVFVEKFGVHFWKQPALWATAAVMLLPSILWYWHAYNLYVEYHNTFGILAGGALKFGYSDILAHPSFYRLTVQRLSLYHFTPLGAIGLLYGSYILWQRRAVFLLSWLGATVAFVFVAAAGVMYGHYHYLLPMLPIGALIIGMAADAFGDTLAVYSRSVRFLVAAQGFLVVAFIANAAVAAARFERRDRAMDRVVWQKMKRTGELVKQLTKPGALVIVSDTQMDHLTPEKSMTPPELFYFADRRGWYRSMAWLTPQIVEDLHAEGAGYFVVSGQAVPNFRANRPDIYAYLASKYRPLLDSDDGIVFELEARP